MKLQVMMTHTPTCQVSLSSAVSKILPGQIIPRGFEPPLRPWPWSWTQPSKIDTQLSGSYDDDAPLLPSLVAKCAERFQEVIIFEDLGKHMTWTLKIGTQTFHMILQAMLYDAPTYQVSLRTVKWLRRYPAKSVVPAGGFEPSYNVTLTLKTAL